MSHFPASTLLGSSGEAFAFTLDWEKMSSVIYKKKHPHSIIYVPVGDHGNCFAVDVTALCEFSFIFEI